MAALPISYTETNVTWENSEFNCDVFGYNIYYTSRNTGIRTTATVYGGDATEVTLQELEEGVIYDISVAALQTERELPEVGPVAGMRETFVPFIALLKYLTLGCLNLLV